jgi:hypothetical protein
VSTAIFCGWAQKTDLLTRLTYCEEVDSISLVFAGPQSVQGTSRGACAESAWRAYFKSRRWGTNRLTKRSLNQPPRGFCGSYSSLNMSMRASSFIMNGRCGGGLASVGPATLFTMRSFMGGRVGGKCRVAR